MELFRFTLVRPAEKLRHVIELQDDLDSERRTISQFRAHITSSVVRQRGVPDVTKLKSYDIISEVDKSLPELESASGRDLNNAVLQAFDSLEHLHSTVSSDDWKNDKRLLAYGIILIFVQGHDLDSFGPDLSRFRQLYDVVEQVSISKGSERDLPVLKPLQLGLEPDTAEDPEEETPPPPVVRPDTHIPRIRDFSAALKFLNSRKALDELETGEGRAWPEDGNILRLKPTWINKLPESAQNTLSSAIDTSAINDLVQLHDKLRRFIRFEDLGHQLEGNPEVFRAGIFNIGQSNVPLSTSWPHTDAPLPGTSLPSTIPQPVLPEEKPSTIRPSGMGQMIVVRSHLKAYEGGDIGHIHSVLKTEHLLRETKRLERTEITETTSEEKETEDEKDTQSTERFALTREVSNVLKSDSQTKFGLSTSLKYGPTVEIKGDVSHVENSSQEYAEKVASQYSKEVVSRAASKVIEKMSHSKTVTQIQQFQENYRHEFDNRKAQENINGIYQWVNKVSESQMFDYGTRLLFDVIVPEPAQFLMELVTKTPPDVAEPPALDFSARDIHEENYMELAARYGATGLKAPPELRTSFSKGVTADSKQDQGGRMSGILEIAIPKGYLAIGIQHGATYVHVVESGGQSHFAMLYTAAGDVLDSAEPVYGVSQHLFSFPPISGTLTVAYSCEYVATFAAVVRVHCVRDPKAYEDWQLGCFNAYSTAHQQLQANYDRIMAQAAVADGTMVSGQNPDENLRIIRTELKKHVISMLTRQSFSVFNGIEPDPATGSVRVSTPAALYQGPYIAFFEQAFEWEELQWMFYPYYWSRQSTWRSRAMFNAADPVFSDFVRAGAARVNFGARPGFERDVLYFLRTGRIWKGGPLPRVQSKDYLPIAEEIANAQGRRGKEKPVGAPWTVSAPTSLVRLRKGAVLPEFESYVDDKTKEILWRETSKTSVEA